MVNQLAEKRNEQEVQYVDVLLNHQNKGGADYDPISIAFISDVHMGSKYFLEETWDKMMHWLNTNSLAKNIKFTIQIDTFL